MQGTGRYSVYVANYASGNVGPHALLEMDEAASDVSKGIIALSDVAAEAGVNRYTGEMSQCLPETWDFFFDFFFEVVKNNWKLHCWSGGRGVVVGPILSESRSDVFCDNENGPNFLFKNNGNGAFVDMATQAGENEVVREHEA